MTMGIENDFITADHGWIVCECKEKTEFTWKLNNKTIRAREEKNGDIEFEHLQRCNHHKWNELVFEKILGYLIEQAEGHSEDPRNEA